jgi:hypothetical protein
MSRRAWIALIVGFVALVGLSMMPAPPRGPTLLSREAHGLALLGRYLEAEGVPVIGWDRPLAELPGGRGLLLIGTPLRMRFTADDEQALRRYLLTGGSVAVLLQGNPGVSEMALLSTLGLSPALGDLPASAEDLGTAMRSLSEPVVLTPSRPGDPPMSLLQPSFWLRAGLEDEVRYTWPNGQAAVSLHRPEAAALGATVLVLPHASLVTNAGLRDNLAALLPLFEEMGAGERLIVDHVHQGILAPESGAAAPSTLPMDLLLSHLAAIYVALVWSVARRFGPQLLAPPPARSSQVRDLRVLAALHQRGGHVSAAAARLLTDLSTLSRGRARPLLTEAGVDLAPTTDAGLLALTQAVAALQRDKRL